MSYLKNTHQKKLNRGFIGTIIGIVLVVLCLIGFYVLLFHNKTTYVAPDEVKETATTTTDSTQASDGQVTYVSTIDAEFEGHTQISFQFKYPKNLFTVTATPDGKKVTLSERLVGNSTETIPSTASTSDATTTSLVSESKATTTVHTLTVTFEGGRGYTPDDYWKNVAKKTCADCIKSRAPFVIAGADTTLTYENNHRIIHIVEAPDGQFLFIFDIQKPSTNIVQALKTFTFK